MGKRVDFTNRRMLYRQVRTSFLARSRKAFMHPERLFQLRGACRQAGSQQIHCQESLQELVDEGILYRVQGNGTLFTNASSATSSNSIGILLPLCDAEMEMLLLNGMQRALRETKYSMTLLVSNNDSEKELEEIRHLRDEQVPARHHAQPGASRWIGCI